MAFLNFMFLFYFIYLFIFFFWGGGSGGGRGRGMFSIFSVTFVGAVMGMTHRRFW